VITLLSRDYADKQAPANNCDVQSSLWDFHKLTWVSTRTWLLF